jgi:tripartite-type tricarboxylate transporter receptor subunit TctC
MNRHKTNRFWEDGMTADRRNGFAIAGWLARGAILVAIAAPAAAQTYPDKPIRLVVPSAAGGPTDVPARLLSQILPKLGQPVVVENRPGAGGAIGARSVVTSAPDGYTLLVGNTSVFAVIPAVSASAGYDPAQDLGAIAKVSESYQILVVPPSSPFNSVAELVAFARANPGRLNIAHTGTGGLPHLTAELFKARAGIDIVGVPYKGGGEAVTGLLGEQVDMTFEGITILLPLIRDGKLRALAVTSRTRTALAPDLPTMIEAGTPDYVVTTFNGVAAPVGTPQPIIDLLNRTINEGLASVEMQATITRLGAEAKLTTPGEFADFMSAEKDKWSAVVKAANVRID